MLSAPTQDRHRRRHKLRDAAEQTAFDDSFEEALLQQVQQGDNAVGVGVNTDDDHRTLLCRKVFGSSEPAGGGVVQRRRANSVVISSGRGQRGPYAERLSWYHKSVLLDLHKRYAVPIEQPQNVRKKTFFSAPRECVSWDQEGDRGVVALAEGAARRTHLRVEEIYARPGVLRELDADGLRSVEIRLRLNRRKSFRV